MSEFWSVLGATIATHPGGAAFTGLAVLGMILWSIGSIVHKFFDHLTERARFNAVARQNARTARADPPDEEEDPPPPDDPPPDEEEEEDEEEQQPETDKEPAPQNVYDRIRENAKAGREPEPPKTVYDRIRENAKEGK